jgi:tRNA/rRNA methyltransferase
MSGARALDPTRFVLIGTSHPGNVGAAARAMKVMGFADLVLVAPRDPLVLQHPQALAMASGATDVLLRARVVAELTEALDGVTYVCATAMTPRDFGPPTHAPRELFAALAPATQRVAFVFGSERFGMANEAVYRCHACVSIPTAAGYGSLNLAQAVQLLAYDWRIALGQQAGVVSDPPRRTADAPADAVAVARVLEHARTALTHVGYLDPSSPKKLLARLNQWFNRSRLTVQEVQILHGIARAMEDTGGPGPAHRSTSGAPDG